MKRSLLLFFLLYTGISNGQSLPEEMYLTPDGRMLMTGRAANSGFFDQSIVRSFYLTFSQPNYWTLLLNNYNSRTELPASLQIDGLTFDSVGVRFKGQTSYSGVSGMDKKSFNITLDAFIDGQDIYGYNTLNLNNGFQDHSMMREVFYQHQIRKHIPATKSNYVKLYINGADWGVYPCIQQIDGDFYKEWFLSKNGTNWRADRPPGSGGGGGGWGDGTAAMNYLGADTTLYKSHYTLKKSYKTNPWTDLVNVCRVLDTTNLNNIEETLSDYLDIDRTLWHLASEILFSDDDGYVYKGKMDYYLYYEAETGRFTPIEYDGNSVMSNSRVTWSPFYNQTNANYPLLNRLLAVPSLRQRYLAHMRTLMNDCLDTTQAYATLNRFAALIDTMVQNDPKKLYTYTQFVTGVQTLKTWIVNRNNYLLSNAEVIQTGPLISDVSYISQGVQWQQPVAMEPVNVTARIISNEGIDHVTLYYATGVVGNFDKLEMFDDGLHNDSAAGDGIYGANIPGLPGGNWVRYYIEAASGNAAKSRSYMPEGAEHNVFTYIIPPAIATYRPVVINELMALNTVTASDSSGQFDDWIELYNNSSTAVDLTGYILTDNSTHFTKWEFPSGTIIQPNDYLIVWADEDGSQAGLHCNFKLSASGETILLLNPAKEIVDDVTFGQQVSDMGYARVPNGTGNFVIQAPTFGYNNDLGTSISSLPASQFGISIAPNPANHLTRVYASDEESKLLEVMDRTGRIVQSYTFNKSITLNTSELAEGLYFVRCGSNTKRLIIQH